MAESALDQALLAPLPWQQVLWEQLQQRLESERLPHSLFFHGAAGTGKRAFAKLFAQRLLCDTPDAGLPCQRCSACQLFIAGNHPDFFYAHREFGAAAEDEGKKSKKTAAPSKQIKIDCVREVIRFAGLSAHQRGRKVVLLEPVEALNHNAANALLKVLEEPAANLHFILVGHQIGKVLPTIKSRCQKLACPRPSAEQSVQWLSRWLPAERAQKLLALCDGAPLAALGVFEREEDVIYQQLLSQLKALRAGHSNYLAAADLLAKHDLVVLLRWWLKIVHVSISKRPDAAMCEFYDQLLRALLKAEGTANPNPRLLLEVLLMAWQQLPNHR